MTNRHDDGPATTVMLILAAATCGFLFGLGYGVHHADVFASQAFDPDADAESLQQSEYRQGDAGMTLASWDADLTAVWLSDAAPGSANYALASTPGDLIFSLGGEALVRLHPDGGAEVHGKPAGTKAAICEGLQEWIKAEGFGGGK